MQSTWLLTSKTRYIMIYYYLIFLFGSLFPPQPLSLKKDFQGYFNQEKKDYGVCGENMPFDRR